MSSNGRPVSKRGSVANPPENGTYVQRSAGTAGVPSAPLPFVNAADFGLVMDGLAFGAGAMTAGSAVLTDTTNKPFKAGGAGVGDIGKYVAVVGAGVNVGDNLWATVVSYGPATDGSQVTLSVAAGQTVSGAIYTYGSDQTAQLTAFVNAVNTVRAGGAQSVRAVMPRGFTFATAALPNITAPVQLEGAGATLAFGGSGTAINFAPGVPGLMLSGSSTYSSIKGIYLRSQSVKTRSGTTENGFTCSAIRPSFEDVIVDGFGQDGFNFDSTISGNSNLAQIGKKVLSLNNGRDGFHMTGNNSNVMIFVGSSATGNGRDGYHNESPANVFISTHTQGNGRYDYYDKANGSFWLTPYGEAPSTFYIDSNSKYGMAFFGNFGNPTLVWNTTFKSTWWVWQQGAMVPDTGQRFPGTGIQLTRTNSRFATAKGAPAASSLSTGFCYYTPFVVDRAGTIIGVELRSTVAAVGASLSNIGVYASDGTTFAPTGDPIGTIGTVDLTAAAATFAVLGNVVIPSGSGTIYWMALTLFGATGNPTLQQQSGIFPFIPMATNVVSGGVGYRQIITSNALPTVATLDNVITSVPTFTIRT